jgi:hypothetical protein
MSSHSPITALTKKGEFAGIEIMIYEESFLEVPPKAKGGPGPPRSVKNSLTKPNISQFSEDISAPQTWINLSLTALKQSCIIAWGLWPFFSSFFTYSALKSCM